MKLSDSAAERAVLSGIFNYGEDVYFDICDLIQEQSFTIDSNIYLYKCLKHIFTNHQNPKIDVALVLSAAEELSLSKILTKKEEIQHLQAIINFPVEKGNLRKFAAKIKKLEIARLLQQQLEEAKDRVVKISGNESIGNIVGIAEDIIFNFTSMLSDTEDAPSELGKNIQDYIDEIIANPIDQIGIPTGFPVYDKSIGGGLRKSTVNVIAARPKTGKTLLADNMSFNIADVCDVPVLNLDTEMTREDHINRTLAMMTDVEINEIETGQFSKSPTKTDKINKAANKLKNLKIFHKSIAGKPFEDQLSLVRRWLIKDVGLNEDGTAKDCVYFMTT